MTIPVERYNAVLNVRGFLYSLADAKLTPRIPKAIRKEALSLLKHYPTKFDLDSVVRGDKNVFAENYEVF